MSTAMAAGMSRMWATNSRCRISVPGYGPSKTSDEIQVPTSGIERMMALAIRRPVPESWSSSSE